MPVRLVDLSPELDFLTEYNGIIDFKENKLCLEINDSSHQLEQETISENKSHQLIGKYQEVLTTK